MLYRIARLYRPELFEGEERLRRRRSGYFEEWYFKAASEAGAWAFIPGVSIAGDDSHSFVQVNGPSGSAYHRFTLEEFRATRTPWETGVGASRFSLTTLDVDVPGQRAHLDLTGLRRWPSTPLAPSSMGWYGYACIMECYHGIIALDGKAFGTIGTEGTREWRFYLEKD